MIESNAGHDTQISVDNIDGIEPPTQPNFQHLNVDAPLSENPQGCERGNLEVGKADSCSSILDRLERCDQLSILDLDVVDTNSLVKTIQMRGYVTANALARMHQCGGQDSHDAALTVCPGDRQRCRR